VSQQHRHEYAAGFPHGLPVRLSYTARKFPPPPRAAARAAPGPYPPDLEPVAQVKDVKRRFLAYSFPPRSPDPPHLAVLERPGFVRAAPALPAATRIRLPSATATCCDRPQAKVSHLHTDHSASRRKRDVRQIHKDNRCVLVCRRASYAVTGRMMTGVVVG
jgi:hypothetical protein